MNINKMIDYTLLKPIATVEDIEKLASTAIANNYFSVCVNPYFVELAKHYLKDSEVKVCTVVGFPLGANTIETKVSEAKQAVKDGADEVDMVMNIGAFKSKNYDYVLKEIDEVCKSANVPVKVIVETCLLDSEELKMACNIINKSNALFIKTSTGFSTAGAKLEDIKLMKKYISKNKQIKASGGIADLKTAQEMISAGATRIGTSKNLLAITN